MVGLTAPELFSHHEEHEETKSHEVKDVPKVYWHKTLIENVYWQYDVKDAHNGVLVQDSLKKQKKCTMVGRVEFPLKPSFAETHLSKRMAICTQNN